MAAATFWVSAAVLVVAVATLIVGILALRSSIGGGRDTSRIRQDLTLDRTRRTAEMRPRLVGNVMPVQDSDRVILVVSLETPWSLSSLEVILPDQAGFAFPPADEADTPTFSVVAKHPSRAKAPLRPDTVAVMPIVRTAGQLSQTVTALANCYGESDEQWLRVPFGISMPTTYLVATPRYLPTHGKCRIDRRSALTGGGHRRQAAEMDATAVLLYAAASWREETGRWDPKDLQLVNQERALVEPREFTKLAEANVPADLADELTSAMKA